MTGSLVMKENTKSIDKLFGISNESYLIITVLPKRPTTIILNIRHIVITWIRYGDIIISLTVGNQKER